MYKQCMRPILFRFDSESIHDRALSFLGGPGSSSIGVSLLRSLYAYKDERLASEVFGLHFANPVGLAAGFDKNGVALDALAALGFGHVELGSVTGEAQSGNEKPRIFRLPRDEAIINRMGFPSRGAEEVAERLASKHGKKNDSVLGINLGKTKAVPLERALEDYLKSFSLLESFGDYFVLNVSSPNTPELRKLQQKDRLKDLFEGVLQEASLHRPLLVKVAPDLTLPELDEVLEVCLEVGIQGIIATNTTSSREGLKTAIQETGGLSGRPLREKSRSMVRHIYTQVGASLPIVGVGGVFTSEDALHLISEGASLVQVYTGFIYEGPGIVQAINRGLSAYLDKEGISSLYELRGQGQV